MVGPGGSGDRTAPRHEQAAAAIDAKRLESERQAEVSAHWHGPRKRLCWVTRQAIQLWPAASAATEWADIACLVPRRRVLFNAHGHGGTFTRRRASRHERRCLMERFVAGNVRWVRLLRRQPGPARNAINVVAPVHGIVAGPGGGFRRPIDPAARC